MDLPRFASGDRLRGSDEEVRAVVEGSASYYGKCTVNRCHSLGPDDGSVHVKFIQLHMTFPPILAGEIPILTACYTCKTADRTHTCRSGD
jgi:hypothetical protein